MTLSVTSTGHYKMLESLMITLAISLVIVWWYDFDTYFLAGFGLFFGFELVAVGYLHIEYYLANKNMMVEVREGGLTIVRGGEPTVYASEDISRIVVLMTPSTYVESDIHIFAIGPYNHAKIYLRSGEVIVITSLLCSRVLSALLPLKGVQIDKKRSLFPSILE